MTSDQTAIIRSWLMPSCSVQTHVIRAVTDGDLDIMVYDKILRRQHKKRGCAGQ